MHDPVAARLEGTQKRGKHGGGLLLRIMKQDNAAMGTLQPPQHQGKLLVWAHRVPIARPQVGAEHHDPAPREAVQQRWGRGKAREAEKRRSWPFDALAVER